MNMSENKRIRKKDSQHLEDVKEKDKRKTTNKPKQRK